MMSSLGVKSPKSVKILRSPRSAPGPATVNESSENASAAL
jgi:hypothetical protein